MGQVGADLVREATCETTGGSWDILHPETLCFTYKLPDTMHTFSKNNEDLLY